mmetsp:Transcript_630/g.1068  ORF Transcript_630/g.1068 Transcript_630/m.1068 type:complete len:170 (-) Transcript_630:784-1293(-)
MLCCSALLCSAACIRPSLFSLSGMAYNGCDTSMQCYAMLCSDGLQSIHSVQSKGSVWLGCLALGGRLFSMFGPQSSGVVSEVVSRQTNPSRNERDAVLYFREARLTLADWFFQESLFLGLLFLIASLLPSFRSELVNAKERSYCSSMPPSHPIHLPSPQLKWASAECNI